MIFNSFSVSSVMLSALGVELVAGVGETPVVFDEEFCGC